MNKLFVGSLSWDTDDKSLRVAFEEFGEVRDAKVITDRESGRSRGFGFVTFLKEEDAEDALDQMNGADLDGRRISVDVAKERVPRSDSPRESSFVDRSGSPRRPSVEQVPYREATPGKGSPSNRRRVRNPRNEDQW